MKRRRKTLIVVAVLLGIGMLLAVARHYQLRWATEAYIAQLKAQGEPMDLAQVLPPPVPPEQNSADTLRQAAAVTESDEGWWVTNYVEAMPMVAPDKAMVCWQQPEIRNDFLTNSWQGVETAIAKDKQALAQLRQIVPKPDFDFQIHYERGFDDFSTSNLYLMQSKEAAIRLSTAAICDLHNGDAASATENLRTMLAIAQASRDERFVISELVRITITRVAAMANWELLQSPKVTDAQLAQLQQDWMRLDFFKSTEDAMAMERASEQITLAGERRSNVQLESYLSEVQFDSGKEVSGFAVPAQIFLWRYWCSYSDELRAFKGWQTLINALRLAQTNGSFQDALKYQNEKLDNLGISKLEGGNVDFMMGNVDIYSMLSQSVANLSGIARRVMAVEVAKRMTVTAIALKRYQLKLGNYPSDLNSLVPEFVPAVPLDPIDGQPLRYRLKADGTFLLYSIGPNGKDDGGNAAFEKGVESTRFNWLNPHALDWVWPQPATPEEIQNFYAHPRE